MEFEGDVLLRDTNDGGEIVIENGEILCDKGLRTAVYLSLLGGNKGDDGISDSETWWGNKLRDIPENEILRSRFQAIIRGKPLTSKNLKDAEEAANDDLKWLIDEGIADKVECEIFTENRNFINLSVNILKESKTVIAETFCFEWGGNDGI